MDVQVVTDFLLPLSRHDAAGKVCDGSAALRARRGHPRLRWRRPAYRLTEKKSTRMPHRLTSGMEQRNVSPHFRGELGLSFTLR